MSPLRVVPEDPTEAIEESFADFASRHHEPLEWVHPGTVPVGGLILLGGPQKSLKTWFALNLVSCVAANRPFLGRDVKSGPAVYVLEEGAAAAVADRIRAVGTSMGIPANAFLVHRKGVRLDTTEGLERLFDVVRRRQPALVVLDPLVKLHRREENDAGDMAAVMAAAQELTALGTAVLLVHHTVKRIEGFASVGGSARGSGAIVSSTDGNLILVKTGHVRDADGRVSKVELRLETEMRDSEEERLALEWDPELASFAISEGAAAGPGATAIGGIDPEQLIELVMASPDAMTAPTLAGLVGVSAPTARKALNAAVDRGDLRSIEGKPVRYLLAA